MTRQLVIPFTILILLLAACSPSFLPTQTPETQVVAQEPSDTPTPTAIPATHTPLPEPIEMATPEASDTPAPVPAPATPAQVSETEGPADKSEIIACDGTPTSAQTEGPYYTPNTPQRSNLVEAGVGGTPLLVTGKVLSQNCQPIPGVKLDFWQTDENGEYDNVGYRMRGHQFTDENGNYALETILPSPYPGRTPHIHVKVFAPDDREVLTTQIYFPGISDQVPDGIFQPDLLAIDLEPDASGRQHMAFDFILPN